MSSNKQNFQARGKPSCSSGEKSTEFKKKSQKDAYKQKNYKSSPSLSSSTSEKPLFHYKASSKSEVNPQNDDSKKFNKGSNSTNVQSCSKNYQHVGNPSTVTGNVKLGHKNNPGVPDIVSPLFMSMSAQCDSLNAMPTSRQSQQVPKIHNQSQNKFKHPGAKPKNFKDCNTRDGFVFVPPQKHNFSDEGFVFVQPQNNNSSLKSESKNFPHRQNYKKTFPQNKNHDKILRNKDNSVIEQQHLSIKLDNSSKTFTPPRYFVDHNSKVNSIKNSTPIVKHKKKFKPQNEKSNQGNFNQKCPGYRGRKRNRPRKDVTIKTKECEAANITPLLTFQSCVEPEKGFDLIQFSDNDDDMYSLSQSSTDIVTDLIDFSDDISIPVSQPVIDASDSTALLEMVQFDDDNISTLTLSDEESDSSEISEESNLTSEFSETSALDSEKNLEFSNPTITVEEAFVAVFWDIENCPLPSNKSAVDFVSYVRSTFYEGRSEIAFTATCDVSRLNSSLVRELDEASVTLIHISSLNKNAADKKIMALLQRFQIQYRKSNSAIVLISSDSDFCQILFDMRYQHHIFANLICKRNTRSSLTTAADYYVYFDNILDQLPNRDSENDLQHVLIVTNLPEMKFKQIKSCLGEKLKSFNCRIKYENASMLKIVFKDHSVCVKAMGSLEGFYLKENKLAISYQQEKIEPENKVPEKQKKEKKPKSLVENIEKLDSPMDLLAESKVSKEKNIARNITLCVCVSEFIGDGVYWKNAFEKLWKTNDFSIIWDETFGGCFLINFKSLKKAQRAKKMLQKNQINNPLAPKFLKLIKEDEDLSNLGINVMSSDNDQKKRKIDDHLLIIERKKLKNLQQHEKNISKIKCQGSSSVSGSVEVVTEKLKESKEQMETFINSSKMITNAIKLLNSDSKDLDEKLTGLLTDFTHECNCFASALPIYAKKDEILRKLRDHQVIVIRAETGSGKSTQLTQYVWRDRKNFQNGKIICTQPRKIAAISLAKHVSSQLGSSLGSVVGYQVGMVKKTSQDTKIVYVTDFTMLKILISENLDSVSCLIVDEAHERTIYTDILLGMIKQYLPRYPHLNVIITSATIDTSIFRDYFSLTDDAVLCIPGRIFPVEDVWLDSDVTVDGDYFNKTIDKAFNILSEGPGDVLSFLTTPFETEKAVESFSKRLSGSKMEKKVKIYYLHGKMNSDDQQKVFEKTAKDIRKVIFATNCAETSITIPGIKFVIDCGLVKESQYDSVRNMNILSVSFVSKSSAEQRRGRAGRTEVGKCYRLYSKKNYNGMASNTCPEILRINLGQALLKLLKLGVENPLQFDFIQSPPRELLLAAMNQLSFLNAVDENYTLTELGKNMAALPLEPRLSHLVFQGFESDIGYDTLVTAALVTMSHAIFFRNSDNKEEADKRKRRFCDSESDFISYLAVYKEWVEVPKNSKAQWCVINCINAKSMRIVHELINEIMLILQKELKFNVKLKSDSESYDTLTRLIFFSFSQNLSIFSGHFRYGYRCLNVSDPLLIHPSSSLSAFGQSTPDFVIYDTILKTTRTYIINVSPVPKNIILDAIDKYNFEVDLNALEGFRGTECCISPVGEKIIFSCFIGKKSSKRKELQRKIKELTNSDFIEVDIDVPKGCIKIFGFHFDDAKIKSFISPILLDAQQHLLNEKKEVSLLDNGILSGILSAGGFVVDVVLPGEFRDLKVILKNEGVIEPVLEKLALCGQIAEVRQWQKYYKVTFETPASAKIALSTYNNENEFSLYRFHRYSPINEKDYLYKVFMSFLRRPCSGMAYVTVEPKISSCLLPSLLYDGKGAQMSISKKTGDIRIAGLPPHTDRKKLESMLSEILPPGVKLTKCLVIRRKPNESNKEEMEFIKRNITELFAEFTIKENVSVFLKKPVPKDFYWNATVYFKNSLDGENAINVLRSRKDVHNFVGGFILKPQLQTYLCCKTQIFSVVKEEIEEALQFFRKDQAAGNSLNITAIPKGSDIVQVKIEGNNIRDVTDARRCIHVILSGTEVKFLDNSNKIKLFSSSGKEWIEKLSSEFVDCYLLQNDHSKTLSIFGKETSCNIIKMRINEYLCNLEKNDYKELNLKTDSGKGGVLKALLKDYGYDLLKLKEECELADVQFNKYKQLLIIQGPSSSISKCESIVDKIKLKLEANCFEVKGEVCPVCYDEISEEKHRLECCGHAYCSECLLHLLQNSDNIPLKCEVQLCEEFIVLPDIFWAIYGRKSLEKNLFNKFLHSFVENRDDIGFCPSPDCPMVYRITKNKMDVHNCAACGNNICTKCGELYHGGLSCNFQKALTSDIALQNWMKEDPFNHKLCPSCNAPIEKDGGCNHMTCWKCKSHICWLCLKVFPTGNDVYNHQKTCPVNQPLIHPLM